MTCLVALKRTIARYILWLLKTVVEITSAIDKPDFVHQFAMNEFIHYYNQKFVPVTCFMNLDVISLLNPEFPNKFSFLTHCG